MAVELRVAYVEVAVNIIYSDVNYILIALRVA